MLLERNKYLGGVLPQCIHNGFGTQIYDRDFTGGEYAHIWRKKIAETDVDVRLNATVTSYGLLDNKKDKCEIIFVDDRTGRTSIVCDAVIAATGCRERTIPQLDIPGSRPAGIFTAGSAQLMMNTKNYLPGKSAVILGSGDIGLIMARRMTLEGIKVKLILGEKATGLARNIVQCIDDFNIPIRYGWTVAATHGYKRLKGVTVIEKKTGKTEYIPCDTLLVAAGLVPETELFSTSCESDPLYFCGNADHVHDLVDNVTLQAVKTAVKACKDAGLEYVPDEVGRYLTAKPAPQPKEKKAEQYAQYARKVV